MFHQDTWTLYKYILYADTHTPGMYTQIFVIVWEEFVGFLLWFNTTLNCFKIYKRYTGLFISLFLMRWPIISWRKSQDAPFPPPLTFLHTHFRSFDTGFPVGGRRTYHQMKGYLFCQFLLFLLLLLVLLDSLRLLLPALSATATPPWRSACTAVMWKTLYAAAVNWQASILPRPPLQSHWIVTGHYKHCTI